MKSSCSTLVGTETLASDELISMEKISPQDDVTLQVAESRKQIIKAIAQVIKDTPVNNGATPGNLPWAEDAATRVYDLIEAIALQASTMPLQPDNF